MHLLARVLGASLLSIVALFVVVLLVNVQSANTERQLNDFSSATKDLQILTLTARRNEKDFYLRKQASYVEGHKATLLKINETLERLKTLAPDDAASAQLDPIKKSMADYGRTFAETAQLMTKLGLDEKSGLHGAFRETIHDSEKRFPADAYEIKAIYLQMRRDEKDFIQREREEYVTAHAALLGKAIAASERLKLPSDSIKTITEDFRNYTRTFAEFATVTLEARQSANVARDAVRKTEPLVEDLLKYTEKVVAAGQQSAATIRIVVAIIAVLILLVSAFIQYLLVKLISRSVIVPVNHLQETIGRLQAGDESARAAMQDRDELGELGRAFDGMIEARIAVQKSIVDENEKLNDSVLNLLQAVAVLARRDLTHKVPVTEDVTGPVADALNLLTNETAKVLRQVSDLSADVATASLLVQEQSSSVIAVAANEQEEVRATAASLSDAADAMGRMTTLARGANQSAELAMRATRQALETVSNTVSGINLTRDTMRETEKQIKRLGERSQDISQAVNLINSIAERTHILALNASMHAASAGEAGRGFAVVADEVQRLAESSRQATQQIAALVKNIQADTAETVGTMNSAIEQVVNGSRLAEQAGTQMQETERTTADLVRSVQEIAASTEVQLKNNQALLVRADAIRSSTEQTSLQLRAQASQAVNLVDYARSLVAAVRVFKLAD
jgi:methyl-accepting chemotaxis protein